MSAEFDPTLERVQPRTWVPLKIEDLALAFGMAVIALITAANVVTRYVSNISLAFTEEYSVFLMVCVTLVGTASTVATGRNIRIDYFITLLPARAGRWLELVGLAVAVLTFAVIAVYGTALVVDEWRFEVLTSGLGQPQWLFTAVLPVLSVAVILRAFGQMIRLLREAR